MFCLLCVWLVCGVCVIACVSIWLAGLRLGLRFLLLERPGQKVQVVLIAYLRCEGSMIVIFNTGKYLYPSYVLLRLAGW